LTQIQRIESLQFQYTGDLVIMYYKTPANITVTTCHARAVFRCSTGQGMQFCNLVG